jgi:hypothetical protein
MSLPGKKENELTVTSGLYGLGALFIVLYFLCCDLKLTRTSFFRHRAALGGAHLSAKLQSVVCFNF